MSDNTVPMPFNHTGHFIITSGGAGAPTLNVLLSVPANSSTVTGHGLLSQAVNPPLHANNAFTGVVHALGSTTPAHQIYALHGTAVPPLLGAPHISQLLVTLKGIWGETGEATYSYVTGSTSHEIKNAPVKVQWLIQK
jgi:hypothetical protein